jgi:hypothetical protein
MGWFDIGGIGQGGTGSAVTSANYTIKPITGVPSGNFQVKDGDGKTLTTIPLDANGKGSYIRQIKSDNVGQQNLQVSYMGNHEFQGLTQDNFVSHVADANGNNSTTSVALTVNKLIAGPGIYISPNNGYGDVMISTQPINDPTQDYLNDIAWTITETSSTGLPSYKYSDQSMFVAVGANGCDIYSDDSMTWSDMGLKNAQAGGGGSADLVNITVLQRNNLSDDGVLYYSVQQGVYTGGGNYVTTNWGRLGYRNSSGVYIGDSMINQGGRLTVNGADITEQIIVSRCLYSGSGSLDNALYLVLSVGGIYKTNGIPCDQHLIAENTTVPTTKELTTSTANTAFLEVAANATATIALAVSSTSEKADGKVWRSYRSGNSTSTWTNIWSSANSFYGVCHGSTSTPWAIVGYNTIQVSTSSNASSFITRTNPMPNVTYTSVAYGGGKFIAVGNGGILVYSEDDGVTWKRGDSGTKNNLSSITYSPKLNLFVAVGDKRTTVSIKGK